jgi:hypothetical protein
MANKPRAIYLPPDLSDATRDAPLRDTRWEFVSFILGMLIGLVLLLVSLPTHAQSLPAAQQQVQSLAQRAGVIFTGQVISIRARSPQGQWIAAGSPSASQPVTASMRVEISFQVEQGIRGVASGSTYTLREWGGLWTAGVDDGRYRFHQRALVMLYPTRGVLSSPVGGMDGVLPLRGPANASLVDLSWIQARLQRAQPIAAAPIAHPIASPSLAHAAAVEPAAPPTDAPLAIAPLEASTLPVATLLAALRSVPGPPSQ